MYPITWEDEFAINIWLKQGKTFHLFAFTIQASIKFSEPPVSIRTWKVIRFILTLTIVFERQSVKAADILMVDTIVAEQFLVKKPTSKLSKNVLVYSI